MNGREIISVKKSLECLHYSINGRIPNMQVTSNIHALRIPFKIPVKPDVFLDRFVYAFIISGKEITLIDTGVASAQKVIFDYLKSIGRDPKEIKRIILTHSHPDHIGSAKSIKALTGCSVLAHGGERNWIEDVELQNRERPVPGFSALVGGSVTVDRVLNDGDLLDLGDAINLKVYHTPGHSKGSISLFLQEEGVLLSGDAIPVAGDLPVYENFSQSLESVRKLQRIQNIKILLASWDQPRQEDEVYGIMNESVAYLERIHSAVAGFIKKNTSFDPMDLCRSVVPELGLPPSAVSPMMARSLMANVKELRGE
jgi:hydroxyacylglutathione hydrolase